MNPSLEKLSKFVIWSFPQHKVKNLLKAGSGKWTSPKGHDEVYVDVELSLPSCYIKSLDIGNMWSHSVDIEVGRADKVLLHLENKLSYICSDNLARNECKLHRKLQWNYMPVRWRLGDTVPQ